MPDKLIKKLEEMPKEEFVKSLEEFGIEVEHVEKKEDAGFFFTDMDKIDMEDKIK